MARPNDPEIPSMDSATTTRAPSEHSNAAVSPQINQDLEKGAQAPLYEETKETGDVNAEISPEKSISDPSDPPGPGPPPDGGFEAWMTVVGAFCGLFVSFGWINCTFALVRDGNVCHS